MKSGIVEFRSVALAGPAPSQWHQVIVCTIEEARRRLTNLSCISFPILQMLKIYW